MAANEQPAWSEMHLARQQLSNVHGKAAVVQPNWYRKRILASGYYQLCAAMPPWGSGPEQHKRWP